MNIDHVSFLGSSKRENMRPDEIGRDYLIWHLAVRCPCGEVVQSIAFRSGWLFWYHERHIHRRHVGTLFWNEQVVLVHPDTVWTCL